MQYAKHHHYDYMPSTSETIISQPTDLNSSNYQLNNVKFYMGFIRHQQYTGLTKYTSLFFLIPPFDVLIEEFQATFLGLRNR